MQRRALELALSAGLVLLMLSALARPLTWDSFPISSYPMFSRGDLGRVLGVEHVLYVTNDGKRTPVPSALLGTPEPMVATAIVDAHIARGTAAELCKVVASRMKERGSPAGVVAIEVATSWFDTKAYFTRTRAPKSRTIHAGCAVPR